MALTTNDVAYLNNKQASALDAAKTDLGNRITEATEKQSADLKAHTDRTDNPHNVKWTQAGADKAGTAQTKMNAHLGEINPHSVTYALAGALSRLYLLWSNADDTQVFDGQTVEFDATDYSMFLVVYRLATDRGTYTTQIAFKGLTMTANGKFSAQAGYVSRDATPSDSGILFGNGYSGANAGTKYMIPYKVYGIKGAII